jgi:hypothetical protein
MVNRGAGFVRIWANLGRFATKMPEMQAKSGQTLQSLKSRQTTYFIIETPAQFWQANNTRATSLRFLERRNAMRFAIAVCCAAFFSGLTGGRAQAFYYAPCPIPCCLSYELQPVVCYRSEWRAEKVPCVVQRVSYRQEVTPVKTQVWAPQEFEQKVRTSYYVPLPREVERDAWRCVMTPVTMFDPCTCCTYVSYCPQWVVQKVRCVEYDYRKEERDVVVKVCKMVPKDVVVQQVRWIPEVTQEQSWTVRYYCVSVPYQTMVWVPCWR